MTKEYLLQLLDTFEEEEEIFVKINDTLYDFDVEQVPETFDGFDTVYPAALALIPKEGDA